MTCNFVFHSCDIVDMAIHIVIHPTDLIGDSCGMIGIPNKIIVIATRQIIVSPKSVIFAIRDVSSSIVNQVSRAIHLIGGVLCCDQVAGEQQDDKAMSTLHFRCAEYQRNYIKPSIDFLYDRNRILCWIPVIL